MYGIVITAVVIIYYYINSTKDIYNSEVFSSGVEENREKDFEDENMIIVHVTGEVKNVGIVKVKENARINDVIEAAGGLTENADLDNVNLAYVVEDGQKIYIPSILDEDKKEEDNNIILEDGFQSITRRS